MPSMAAASNGGDDRVAQTGSAVTRPTAWSSGSRTTSSRSGQPAAAHASSHEASASAAGWSWMNGAARATSGTALPDCAARGKPGGRLGHEEVPVGGGEDERSEELPKSGSAAGGSASAPAASGPSAPCRRAAPGRRRGGRPPTGRSRVRRAVTLGSGGGSVHPPTIRTIGIPISRNTTSAERGLPGSPITGIPPTSASSVGLPGFSDSP